MKGIKMFKELEGKKNCNLRTIMFTYGGIITILLWILTDPATGLITKLPIGAGTAVMILFLLKAIVYTSLAHMLRKALLFYVDLEAYFAKAMETPQGAGYAIIGASIFFLSVALIIFAATNGS